MTSTTEQRVDLEPNRSITIPHKTMARLIWGDGVATFVRFGGTYRSGDRLYAASLSHSLPCVAEVVELEVLKEPPEPVYSLTLRWISGGDGADEEE